MGKSKDKFKITVKHRRFIKFLVETGGNASEAARRAGFSAVWGRTIISNPTILDAYETAQRKAGLTDELLLGAHVELLTQKEDKNVRLGAVRLGYQVNKKIGGDDVPIGDRVPNIFIIMDGTDGDSESGRHKVQAHKSPNISIQIAD